MWQDQFEYIDLEQIDQRFKCSICTKPYLDPVSLPQPCEQTFCLQCIQNNFTNHVNHCRSCYLSDFSIKDLKDEGPFLCKLVNNLLVRCILCHEENIPRMKFVEHAQQYCPRRIVHCSAYDVQCSWQGEYDQFNDHFNQCPYEQLRILLTQLSNDKQRLEQFNQLTDRSNEQINQFHQLNQTLEEKNVRIDKLENENRLLIDSMNKSNSIQSQNQSLIQTNQQQIQLITKENEQLNEQLIHFKQIKQKNEQLEQSNICYQQQIKQISIDYQRLIAKLYQPMISFDYLSQDSNYENRQLKELIESCSNKSLINIINETINENDMKIIINDGCINKQCQSLIFIQTNFIENSLINFFSYLNLNRTLRKLILSKINFSNQLMECLCQSLLFNNQTIKELILNSNQINDQLMIYLIHLFQLNQTIRIIGLHENQITNQSFQHFSHVMTLDNQIIEEISFYLNPFITDQSIQSIIHMINNHQPLKTFWLWNCQLSDQGKQHIQQSIISNQTSQLDLRL